MLTESRFDRTRALLSDTAVETLSQKSVLVAGLGGVGSWAAEALARAGVGRLILIDGDVVSPRISTDSSLRLRARWTTECQVARCRLYDINGRLIVDTMDEPSGGRDWRCSSSFRSVDYVIDAIDSLSAKIDLIATAEALWIPIIVSMGTGNRLDPTRLKIADLSETHTDPLARIVRRELRKRDIEHVKVVFSEEPPVTPIRVENRTIRASPSSRLSQGSLASEVIRDLTSFPAEKKNLCPFLRVSSLKDDGG